MCNYLILIPPSPPIWTLFNHPLGWSYFDRKFTTYIDADFYLCVMLSDVVNKEGKPRPWT